MIEAKEEFPIGSIKVIGAKVFSYEHDGDRAFVVLEPNTLDQARIYGKMKKYLRLEDLVKFNQQELTVIGVCQGTLIYGEDDGKWKKGDTFFPYCNRCPISPVWIEVKRRGAGVGTIFIYVNTIQKTFGGIRLPVTSLDVRPRKVMFVSGPVMMV